MDGRMLAQLVDRPASQAARTKVMFRIMELSHAPSVSSRLLQSELILVPSSHFAVSHIVQDNSNMCSFKPYNTQFSVS